MSFIKDILQTNDPEKEGGNRFSLSRVILLIASLLYMTATGIGYFLTFSTADVNVEALTLSIDSLKWIVITFAAYSFGGKFLKSTTAQKNNA